MPEPETLTLETLIHKYCSRQDCTEDQLKARLTYQVGQWKPLGFLLLECKVLDSSRCGEYVILPYGPNNTFKSIPDHPITPRGLASDMSVVVGVLPASEVSSS